MSVNKQLNLLSYPYKYCLQKPEAMTSRKFTLYFDLRKEKKKSLVATGIDEAAGRCCLIGLQVLIKQLTGADQLADSC